MNKRQCPAVVNEPGMGVISKCARDEGHMGPHMDDVTMHEWTSGALREPKSGPGDWLASLTSAERKECAVSRGFFAYFPDAIAMVARHSVRQNEKHNPGEPVHWDRAKSTDEADCEARHLIACAIDRDIVDGDGHYEIVAKAWRAMADLQKWIEYHHARGTRI